MKKVALVVSMMILSLFVSKAEAIDVLNVTSYKLENGLTVWLNEDHTAPVAYGALVVNAGARDCPGTGIAHYFEHMMFKGTDKIGTVDYKSEKPYLDSIAVMYDSLATATDNAIRERIQKEINRLNVAGSRYAVPNEFATISTLCGSSDLNAYTSQDLTVYHSDFMPQHFEQWAELNSERIISPVFRLFQSELETVYEEKNMYSDDILESSYEKMEGYGFKGTPYEFPIIGTTDNLKNPRLSQMTDYFNTYYVAGNMCLILTGDFDSDAVKPVIERTFGRIRKGNPVVRQKIIQPDFSGQTQQDILVNIPVIQMEAFFYKAPSFMNDNYMELRLLSYLLNNSEGVGLLDRLVNDNKLMFATGEYDAYSEAGGYLIVFAPKIAIQSTRNAKELVMGVIEQLKKGDFDDELLQSCKLSYLRNMSKGFEDIEDRVGVMARVFNAGHSWNDYLESLERIRSITREDIVRTANQIFTADHIVFHKKTGNPGKDKLRKPQYENIPAQSKDSTSQYAKSFMESALKAGKTIREFDSKTAVSRTQITPLVSLYSSTNPVNDIFDLKIKFLRGSVEEPSLSRLAAYLNMLGTKERSYDALFRELQELGGTAYFKAEDNCFSLNISGYDSNFEKTVALAGTLLKDIVGDKKKLKAIIDDEKAETAIRRKDIGTIVRSIYLKAAYGDKSPLVIDKGKADSDYLLGIWRKLQSIQCDILYTGNLSCELVRNVICNNVDVNDVTIPSDAPKEYEFRKYDNSEVFFINKPDASQTMVYAYMPSDTLRDSGSRAKARLLNYYLGVDMNSVLFQEIREFRSMAYMVGSDVYIPEWKNRDKQGVFFIAGTGTQCDKAIDAMHVLDSLLAEVPIRTKIFIDKKNEFFNRTYHSYPGFRDKNEYAELLVMNGLEKGKAVEQNDIVTALTEEDFESFIKEYLSGRPIVWCVVGNSKKMDMTGLGRFGKVTTLKVSDVIK